MAKAGRPAFQPSDEQRRMVEAMVSFGIPREQIARVVGIDDETLRKHFREEIDTGVAKANTRVATYLFEHASGQRGDGGAAITAAIFWLKTRARWKETQVNELSGPDGGPIEISAEAKAREIAAREARAREIIAKAFGAEAA